MTIDEAIKHAEEVMIENLEKTKDRNASDPIAINCFECADEHRQLAEWLKDYKRMSRMLEKIRAEIAEIAPLDYPCDKRTPERIRDMALEIIDKYADMAKGGE